MIWTRLWSFFSDSICCKSVIEEDNVYLLIHSHEGGPYSHIQGFVKGEEFHFRYSDFYFWIFFCQTKPHTDIAKTNQKQVQLS